MIVGGGVMPRTPVLVPEVGRGRERSAVRTVGACRRLARSLGDLRADTLIICVATDGRHPVVWLPEGDRLRAGFAALGAAELDRTYALDRDLAGALAGARGSVRWSTEPSPDAPESALGALYFTAGAATAVCVIGVPADVEAAAVAGRDLAGAAAITGRRAALLIAGDLGSRTERGAPGGRHPDAVRFDQALTGALGVDAITGAALHHLADRWGMVQATAAYRATSGEVVLAPLVAAVAALAAGPAAEVLSYEAPFGVGYLVALLSAGGNPTTS